MDKTRVLPSRFYGDPSNVVDEMRRETERAKKQAERDRIKKGRRIRKLTKLAMKGGKQR